MYMYIYIYIHSSSPNPQDKTTIQPGASKNWQHTVQAAVPLLFHLAVDLRWGWCRAGRLFRRGPGSARLRDMVSEGLCCFHVEPDTGFEGLSSDIFNSVESHVGHAQLKRELQLRQSHAKLKRIASNAERTQTPRMWG